MLLVGTIQNLYTTDKTKILNFCSLNEMYPRLRLLPPFDFRFTSGNPETMEYEFDMKYAQWLLSDPNAFIDFMQIIYNMYLGYDVFLLISEDNILALLCFALICIHTASHTDLSSKSISYKE